MMDKIIKIPVGDKLKVDISNGGIDAYIGDKKSILTRNHVSIILEKGIPGTGFYTMNKDGKYNPLFLIVISFFLLLGFCMLTAIAIHSDYSFEVFTSEIFSIANIVYFLLFLLCNFIAIIGVHHYKCHLCRKYTKYKDNLQKEIDSVRVTLEQTNGTKHDILRSYLECLLVEQEIIEVEPVLSAIENYPKKYSKIHDDLKQRFSDLQIKLQDTRYKVDAPLEKHQMANYYKLCETFELLDSSSRFWDITSLSRSFDGGWVRVNFGTGMFDYILSNSYPPILQTSKNGTLYFYSTFAVLARSSVDFDILPLESIHMDFDYVPDNIHYAVLTIQPLNLKFTTSNPEYLKLFIDNFEAYKRGEYNTDEFSRKDSLLEEVSLYIILKRRVSAEMIRRHFNMGNSRTKRILTQLQKMNIITPSDENGMRSIIVWDIEHVRGIIDKFEI